jgi:single-strand DNA-binding protein
MNLVMLIGHLGKDPELKRTQNDLAICNFSLATSEKRKDEAGNWIKQTEWHNIVVLGQTAENCAKYLEKGRQVAITGKIQTRKWQDETGQNRYKTDILANNVEFLGRSETKQEKVIYDTSFDDDDIPF